MIPSSRLVYDFDRKYDRHKAKSDRRLKLEDKLALLNESLEIYFENRVKVAETTSSVRNDLRALEVKQYPLKLYKNFETYSIYRIPKESYNIIRQSAIVTKETCGEKEVDVIMFQSDDLNNARKSPYWKSSFQWEHCLADEGTEGLYLYHEGDFEIKDILVDFYRKPKELHAPSLTDSGEYIDWNGVKRTKDTNLELKDTYSHRKITDIAVLLARAYVGDIRDFQILINKELNT